jgi:hypothetical protein
VLYSDRLQPYSQTFEKARDTSFLQAFVNYGCKKFYNNWPKRDVFDALIDAVLLVIEKLDLSTQTVRCHLPKFEIF